MFSFFFLLFLHLLFLLIFLHLLSRNSLGCKEWFVLALWQYRRGVESVQQGAEESLTDVPATPVPCFASPDRVLYLGHCGNGVL